MIIRRMQVEGGWLDGLDLRLDQGLNTLIGGRGTGKSSIIELIRYCLASGASSNEEDAKKSLEQALSVLQDGQVTLSVEHDGQNLTVTRSTTSAPEGLEPNTPRPLIFSQKDVEAVGLSPRGRLNIVDIFMPDATSQKADERKRTTQIQSLTVEIQTLSREVDQIAERLSAADQVRAELARAEARSAELSKSSSQLDKKQKQLDQLSTQATAFTARAESLKHAHETVSRYRDAVLEVQIFGFPVEEWPAGAGEVDLLKPTRDALSKAERHIDQAYTLIDQSILGIENALNGVERERATPEEQARVIRREVEGLKEGAGAAARSLANLREQVSQFEALNALRRQKLERITRIQKQRAKQLDELDSLRDARSAQRQRVAQTLSKSLGPNIRIKIRQSAQLGEFVGAITNALRGSGLRYNELSVGLASAMSPRELVEAVENNDSSFISKAAKITIERSDRIISQLRSTGTDGIATIALDDIADFELLHGAEFKSMDALSVGQRCTVVLSILLQQPDRVLIVDQPEDHLDNAFIVDTLIGAIRRRSSAGQLIFSTHNANIPVLGGAARVVRLGSNGKRGFVMHAEPLDHPKTVEAITTIMEGGREAFRKRDAFYRRLSNE